MKFLILFFISSIFSALSSANTQCPWQKLKGRDLIQFSYSDSSNNELSTLEVQEDLACLKILFENRYVGQDENPEINLIERLNQLSLQAVPMKSSQLIDLIYNLHNGIPDVHLGYQVYGISKRYRGPNKKQVQLNENLENEKIYNRKSFIYFKPAPILDPELTKAQSDLIEIVKNTDQNLVLDLRETNGGGGSFAEKMAENIFTPNQKIPQTKKRQVTSYLNYIGHAVTARISYPDNSSVKKSYDSVKALIENMNFQDLIPYTIHEETTTHKGQRLNSFKSKVFLLIDGTCASECETIVELLSAHPQVKLVGQNTDGALHFSNAVSFTLPHSGIWAQIPGQHHSYENNAVEGVGYSPSLITDFVELDKLPF